MQGIRDSHNFVEMLFDAVLGHDVPTLNRLLATRPDLAAAEAAESTGLVACAVQNSADSDPIPTIEALLSRGADVNACLPDSPTALYLAASHLDPELVQWLVDHGADVNKESYAPPEDITPLEAMLTDEELAVTRQWSADRLPEMREMIVLLRRLGGISRSEH